jgi:ribosomal protein S18 acetylase RimI-like enzyme
MTTNDSTLSLKDGNFPKIPGVNFRNFRGEPDYEAMTAITNASNHADGEEELTTVDDIRNLYAHLENFNPDRDMLFVESEGQAVGYCRCWWGTESTGDHLYRFSIFLLPDWRRDGIPLAMGQFIQERLIEIAAGHQGDFNKYTHTWGMAGVEWHEQLMDQLGLAPARNNVTMTRPCSLPIEIQPLPAGIEVRPATGEADYRKVMDADTEACADHFGFVPPTEADFQRWINGPSFDPTLWKVAWEGDQVVGMVLNYIDHEENQAFNRKRGYTEDISVRPAWRRQGIARALLGQSIHMFQEMNMQETTLAVDAENAYGALKFYEDDGYKLSKRYVNYRAEIS